MRVCECVTYILFGGADKNIRFPERFEYLPASKWGTHILVGFLYSIL